MRILSAVNEFGGGHAWLDIGMPSQADMCVIIERDAEKNCFLGPQGWQSLPAEIPTVTPNGVVRPGMVLLGPSVVDHLKDGDYVTISVCGTRFAESDFWPPIPMSSRKSQGGGVVGGIPTRQPAEPVRLPVGSPPVGPGGSQSPVKPSDQPDTTTGKDRDAGEVTGKPGVWRQPLTIAGAVAAVTLLLVTVYWVWRQLPDDAIASATQQMQEMMDEARNRTSEGLNAVIPGMTGGETRDATYWSGVLSNPATTADQLYSSALETRDAAQFKDLSHELLYQAALRGNKKAVLDYAHLYDPTVSDANGWQVHKNARIALEHYAKLRAAGEPSVTGDIDRLCNSLKPNIFVNTESRTAYDDYCTP